MEWLRNGFNYILSMLSMIDVVDVIDIAILAVILYYIYKFIRDRRAGKLALGVLFIVMFLFLSELLEMHAMQFILKNVFQVGMISLVIVFHPELRSALEKMGGESIKGFKSIGEQKSTDLYIGVIRDICEAVTEMSKQRTGALIVFERSTRLGDVTQRGTFIDAKVSVPLVRNIFFNKSPLHDGAMIIRDGRIYAAGCVLPLSANTETVKDLGTRHMAAIGMSENSDAVVVVVSEETGVISLAYEGLIKRNYTRTELENDLTEFLTKIELSPAKKVKAKFTQRNKSNGGSGKNPRQGG